MHGQTPIPAHPTTHTTHRKIKPVVVAIYLNRPLLQPTREVAKSRSGMSILFVQFRSFALLLHVLLIVTTIRGTLGIIAVKSIDRPLPVLSTPTVIGHDGFRKLVSAAFRSQRPLLLRGRTVDFGSNEFKLDNNFAGCDSIHVHGPGSICGRGHTLFTVGGNRHSLILEKDIQLEHFSSPDRTEKRQQGAAIWARGKARIQLRDNCTVTSESGFALWLVQRANAQLVNNCTVGPCGRSAIVLFNNARLDFDQGIIQHAARHGVCTRGDTVVTIKNSMVKDCGDRGVYAYHNATLNLVNTTVSGTLQVDASAVQVEALRPCDEVQLVVRTCKMTGNKGLGLSVAGNVDCDIDDSVQVDGSLSAEEQLSPQPSPLQY